jgi:uncharacterized membrane protein
MKTKTALFLTIMSFALVTGVFWGTWFSLSRSIASVSPAAFLENGRIFIGNLAMPMRILMPGALLCGMVSAALTRRDPAVFRFTVAGVLLLILAMIITLSVNVPIDNQIKTWTLQSLPADWEGVRDRWEAFHTFRTFVSIGALASVAVAGLKAR